MLLQMVVVMGDDCSLTRHAYRSHLQQLEQTHGLLGTLAGMRAGNGLAACSGQRPSWRSLHLAMWAPLLR